MYMYNDIAGAVHVQAWPCEAGDRSGSLVEQHGDHSTLCESTSALEWSLGAADPLGSGSDGGGRGVSRDWAWEASAVSMACVADRL